jgi:hypothetical protein
MASAAIVLTDDPPEMMPILSVVRGGFEVVPVPAG